MIPSYELLILGLMIGIVLAALYTHLVFVIRGDAPLLSQSAKCSACDEGQSLISRIPVLGVFLSDQPCKKCSHQRSYFVALYEISIILFTTWAFLALETMAAIQISMLFVALLGVAVLDMEKWIIPNRFVVLILVVAALGLISGYVHPLHSLIGLGVALVVSLFIILPQKYGGTDNTIALGDVKLCLAAALWLGWVLSVYVFFLASLLAVLAWGISGFFKGFSTQRRLQFGPFVALSTLIFGIGRVVDPQFVTHLLTFRF